MIIYNNLGHEILDVQVDDNSYGNKAIMGDHNLVLHYSLPEHVEIPVGSYCSFQDETYILERPENFKMKHSRNFEYTVVFDSYQARGKKWKFRNTVDGRLKFSLTATPREHLQMYVDNMNQRDSGWTVGDCIDGTEKLISYDHAYCSDALSQMASEFKTEYEYEGKMVSLHKVEYNKSSPLPLSYGRGNGFKPGGGRTNSGSTPPIEILFVQGGSENIDPSKYGHSELLLPALQTIAYDGSHFENEPGFVRANSRNYVVDDLGLSVRRYDKQLSSLAEDSLDCSEIYPKRIGQVSSVITVDAEHNFYDFTDTSIPDNLDYEECLIEGETMTVIFQSGMLAGREFEVKYFHNPVKNKAARRFEIVPAEIDGQTMPNATFKPIAGDSYAVYKCMLPDSYICDNETKTGASWDMFRAAVKYLFDNEEEKFSFTGELDGIWAKNNWLNVGGRIKLGGFIFFSDAHFQPQGVLIRITGIKTFINKPHSPVITLSNTTVTEGVSSTLKDLKSEEVKVEDLHNNAIQFTKRRFRDAQETIGMLEASLLENFTNSVNPIAVQTMLMLVGDESLQFRFVNSKTDPQTVTHNIVYDSDTKQLSAEAGILQHMTLGIDSLSSQHTTDEYLFWDIEAYASGQLETTDMKYYLYAKVEKNGNSGSFILSENAIRMDGVSGYYHFLVGVLNSEYDGERSFVTLYGFTEILPGRVTTDRVVSANGNSFFDLVANAMKLGDVLDFNTGGDGKMRLRGTLIQSESGDESYIGCYRGVYNASYTYFNGDEVSYTVNSETSTYRYIYATPAQGIAPTDSIHWRVIAKGSNGNDGSAGNFTEVRFAVNGSTTQAPTLSRTDLNPSGWSTDYPSVGEMEYLWMTTAVKTGDGTALISNWTPAVRLTARDGNDGRDGESPVGVYRGLYKTNTTYYGNEKRLDIVKYNGTYYIARIDAGTFSNIAPPSSDKWNGFGATFESVATNLLLAENANIANFIFHSERLESQTHDSEDEPNIYLDGLHGTAKLGWLKVVGNKLIGYDAFAKERLVITPEDIPSIDSLSEETRRQLNITSAVVTGGAKTITGNGCHMEYAADAEWVTAGGGAYTHQYSHASFDCSFTVATTGDNVEVEFTVIGSCSIDNMMPHEPFPQWENIVITSSSHPASFSGATHSGNTVTYHVKVMFSTAGTNTVRMSFRMGEVTDEPERAYSYTMVIDVSGVCELIRPKKTVIGKDGIVSIYNGNYIQFRIGYGFSTLIGRYGLKVASDGIKKTTNGGGTWSDL